MSTIAVMVDMRSERCVMRFVNTAKETSSLGDVNE
jgi:hypothetical protein